MQVRPEVIFRINPDHTFQMNQLHLWDVTDRNKASPDGLGLTFRDSKSLPIHRWYPFVEGFAAEYIRELIATMPIGATVYDPFGGSGTVCLIASSLGRPSAFSELNPFMRFVAETKVNSAAWARINFAQFETSAKTFTKSLDGAAFKRSMSQVDIEQAEEAFPDRGFFERRHLQELLAAKRLALAVAQERRHVRSLLLLAISSVLVHNSNMTRRADLRRRKPGEYKNRIVDVTASIKEKLEEIVSDVKASARQRGHAKFLNEDAKLLAPNFSEGAAKIVTSPPYLNGTNYFRNTKIELWFMEFIESEKDLAYFNDRCVCGGINNISSRRVDPAIFSSVEKIVERLNSKDGDRRIGKMVRQYFADMQKVLANCHAYLKRDGLLHLDIGDSKFYGTHVPTDLLLMDVAQTVGFELTDEKLLARRHSRDKTALRQVELTFKKAR